MNVLIVDDDENIRKTTVLALESMGHEATAAEDGPTALKLVESSQFDAALLDLKLRGESGLDLLPEMLRRDPQLSIIVFTAFAAVDSAIEAMRRGAADYIPKPFTPDHIGQVLAKTFQNRRLQRRLADLESRLRADSPDLIMDTTEPEMLKVYDMLFKAAGSPATILLMGESGTGKSVIARAVHERSPQRDNPCVTVACPSLSRELLESELFGHIKGSFTGAISNTWGKVAQANGGTLFLDEIGEMPLEIQPKLLRLLQEKEYERVGEARTHRANVRVVAATNKNLQQAVREGHFREDLYYRLNVIAVRLPPLRERTGDLLNIARCYLNFFAAQCGKRFVGFARPAEQAMMRYAWPGNFRELRNVVERAMILTTGNEVRLEDLADGLLGSSLDAPENNVRLGAEVSLEELEHEHIRRIVARAPSMEQAAQILGIDPATLYRKRKRLGL